MSFTEITINIPVSSRSDKHYVVPQSWYFLQRQNDLQKNLRTTLPTYVSLRIYTNQSIQVSRNVSQNS